MAQVTPAYPSLSPDGKHLLFQSTRSGRWALYIADPDGNNARVFLDTGADPVGVVWSPDGNQIAYATTTEGQSEISVIEDDGKHRKRLTHDPGDDSHPHWSADGSRIFAQLHAFAGEYVFSPNVSVRVPVSGNKLVAQASGARRAFAVGKDSAVELLPSSKTEFTVPGRYPTTLSFADKDKLVLNPGHWQQVGTRK